jgi:hypothetical protein
MGEGTIEIEISMQGKGMVPHVQSSTNLGLGCLKRIVNVEPSPFPIPSKKGIEFELTTMSFTAARFTQLKSALEVPCSENFFKAEL